MTHIVLDQSVLDALIAAGEDQHQTLGNINCWCRTNVPYRDGQVKQVVTKECQRCKSRKDWAAAKAKAEAAKAAAA